MGLEPRLVGHRSQTARTATLPTAPPEQAKLFGHVYTNPQWMHYYPVVLVSTA